MTIQLACESLDRYAADGVPTGGFLRAVLANDLMEATGRASKESRLILFEICGHVHNKLPAQCHGSYDAVDAWIERKEREREAEAAA